MLQRAGRLLSAILLTASLSLLGGLQLAPTITVSASPLDKMDPRLRAHVSGPAEEALGPQRAAPSIASNSNYFPTSNNGCAGNIGSNIKVNQNCLNVSDPDLQGRAQAQNETSISVDPNNPKHILASYNDYRRGDGTCGFSYSLDGGKSWADSTTPNGFTRGHDSHVQPSDFGAARQYWQAGGDTSVGWDSRGNAYLSCQMFNRGNPPTSNVDQSSGLFVFRSTGNNGASFNFPGRYVTATNDLAGSGTVLEDKQLLTVDHSTSSGFRDRIYVTWTHFTATTAYIYEAFSSDFGESFSSPIQVSPAGTQSLCPAPLTTNGGCDNNQFSQPFTAPDGALYVVYSNYNTSASATTARYQVLLQKSTDGGNTFGPPIKVTDYYELPDCATYQGKDPGRACVPEKGTGSKSFFRAAQYPVGAVNPDNPNRVLVSVGSYINADSQESNGCKPTGVDGVSQGGLYDGVKTAGACANHILVSTSSNGGAAFNGAVKDPRAMPMAMTSSQKHTDQFFQWLTFSNHKLVVSELDRQYGDDETTGNTDQTVLGGPPSGASFNGVRVTTSSMPPPTQFAGVFWGDYSGMSTSGDTAYPLWSDTRSPDIFICPGSSPPTLCGTTVSGAPANDEDIFTAGVGIPSADENGDNNNQG